MKDITGAILGGQGALSSTTDEMPHNCNRGLKVVLCANAYNRAPQSIAYVAEDTGIFRAQQTYLQIIHAVLEIIYRIVVYNQRVEHSLTIYVIALRINKIAMLRWCGGPHDLKETQ